MIKINENYLKLQASYLFADIARRVEVFQKENPAREIIKLGIGDVTRSLPPACIEAFHKGVDEMADDNTFKGYGPEQGYIFLREKIAIQDFQQRGADISPDEIFISDGAKCDTGNILDIFADDIKIAIPDPVYPVYVDTNVMAGRTNEYRDGRYGKVHYMEGNRENGFIPGLPEEPVDLIYMCYPNNPTGATITKDELTKWVDYARETKALILYDAAYESFIRDESIPHSIFEIKGAEEVAIEFRSFSKTAGFTGTRCAFTVIPKACTAYDSKGEKHSLHALWNRRHTTKFNGVSYPVQRAAEAAYSEEGRVQVKELIDYYMKNAAFIRDEVKSLDFFCIGGENSPYIWAGADIDSWEFFDMLLNKAGVVCTPGSGFGKCGNGFIRISAFNTWENVQKAMTR
ncbi:LL-diaminopimelate aminotransferase, partial [Desulfobacterales bacterium HSG16]|nr:LL-diaminopimelate aminotransferase [Desulfobacterales bacterium HSG16]